MFAFFSLVGDWLRLVGLRLSLQALVKAQLKLGADRESRKRAWEENELSSLAKAIVKFPAGSQNRELPSAVRCIEDCMTSYSGTVVRSLQR